MCVCINVCVILLRFAEKFDTLFEVITVWFRNQHEKHCLTDNFAVA